MRTTLKDETIRKFCNEDESKAIFKAPYTQKGYTYATEGHIALKLKGIQGDYSSNVCSHNMDVIFDIDKQNRAIITIAEIKAKLSLIELEDKVIKKPAEEECTECGGDGLVMWEYQDSNLHTYSKWMDCPLCDGTGYLDKDIEIKPGRLTYKRDELLDLRTLSFDPKKIDLIVDVCDELMVDRVIMLYSRDNYKPALFDIMDGVEILLMPMVK